MLLQPVEQANPLALVNTSSHCPPAIYLTLSFFPGGCEMSLAGNSSCVTNPGPGPRPFPYPVRELSPQSLFLQHKEKIIFKNIHCIQHFLSRDDFYVTQRDV